LDNELNQNQDPVSPGGETEDRMASRVAELERTVAERDGELTRAIARITELEKALTEFEERLRAAGSALTEAIASYRSMVIQANPQVPQELITGETIAVVNESLGTAKSIVSRVRQGLETEIQAARVPFGAPQRMPADFSALTPREKIQLSLNAKS